MPAFGAIGDRGGDSTAAAPSLSRLVNLAKQLRFPDAQAVDDQDTRKIKDFEALLGGELDTDDEDLSLPSMEVDSPARPEGGDAGFSGDPASELLALMGKLKAEPTVTAEVGKTKNAATLLTISTDAVKKAAKTKPVVEADSVNSVRLVTVPAEASPKKSSVKTQLLKQASPKKAVETPKVAVVKPAKASPKKAVETPKVAVVKPAKASPKKAVETPKVAVVKPAKEASPKKVAEIPEVVVVKPAKALPQKTSVELNGVDMNLATLLMPTDMHPEGTNVQTGGLDANPAEMLTIHTDKPEKEKAASKKTSVRRDTADVETAKADDAEMNPATLLMMPTDVAGEVSLQADEIDENSDMSLTMPADIPDEAPTINFDVDPSAELKSLMSAELESFKFGADSETTTSAPTPAPTHAPAPLAAAVLQPQTEAAEPTTSAPPVPKQTHKKKAGVSGTPKKASALTPVEQPKHEAETNSRKGAKKKKAAALAQSPAPQPEGELKEVIDLKKTPTDLETLMEEMLNQAPQQTVPELKVPPEAPQQTVPELKVSPEVLDLKKTPTDLEKLMEEMLTQAPHQTVQELKVPPEAKAPLVPVREPKRKAKADANGAAKTEAPLELARKPKQKALLEPAMELTVKAKPDAPGVAKMEAPWERELKHKRKAKAGASGAAHTEAPLEPTGESGRKAKADASDVAKTEASAPKKPMTDLEQLMEEMMKQGSGDALGSSAVVKESVEDPPEQSEAAEPVETKADDSSVSSLPAELQLLEPVIPPSEPMDFGTNLVENEDALLGLDGSDDLHDASLATEVAPSDAVGSSELDETDEDAAKDEALVEGTVDADASLNVADLDAEAQEAVEVAEPVDTTSPTLEPEVKADVDVESAAAKAKPHRAVALSEDLIAAAQQEFQNASLAKVAPTPEVFSVMKKVTAPEASRLPEREIPHKEAQWSGWRPAPKNEALEAESEFPMPRTATGIVLWIGAILGVLCLARSLSKHWSDSTRGWYHCRRPHPASSLPHFGQAPVGLKLQGKGQNLEQIGEKGDEHYEHTRTVNGRLLETNFTEENQQLPNLPRERSGSESSVLTTNLSVPLTPLRTSVGLTDVLDLNGVPVLLVKERLAGSGLRMLQVDSMESDAGGNLASATSNYELAGTNGAPFGRLEPSDDDSGYTIKDISGRPIMSLTTEDVSFKIFLLPGKAPLASVVSRHGTQPETLEVSVNVGADVSMVLACALAVSIFGFPQRYNGARSDEALVQQRTEDTLWADDASICTPRDGRVDTTNTNVDNSDTPRTPGAPSTPIFRPAPPLDTASRSPEIISRRRRAQSAAEGHRPVVSSR
eukprot:TRINITY_DN1873_c0_g1_i2.p1 TRINITY_DN1873_c0_g1~~TRINITY_DN1873_c0_g1_i2.p1  ORF type:complete len:1437 (-),score=372.47 TRINITY_DN1873_c0_g1_i2:69-4052(-)